MKVGYGITNVTRTTPFFVNKDDCMLDEIIVDTHSLANHTQLVKSCTTHKGGLHGNLSITCDGFSVS